MLGKLLAVPPPELSAPALSETLERCWGISGRLSVLTSERDLNHRLDGGDGRRWLVKLTNPAEPETMTDFQTRAFLHVAARDPELPTSRLAPTRGGDNWLSLPQGRLRVFGWLEGSPLHQIAPDPALSQGTGAALGRLTRALEGFDHPAADHVLLWDIKHFARIAPLIAALEDKGLRQEAEAVLADFNARVAPLLPDLPSQICHADFNPHNLLADPGAPERISGILDFGDMVRTARACDLAVAAAYQVDARAPEESLAAFARGYARHVALGPDEIGVLFDLIRARMVTTLAIAGWRARRHPGNAAYILRNAPSARAGLRAMRDLGREAAGSIFRRALPAPE
ncbi:phosphotransferase [Pseudogemmobacter sonorensis]|uniref:phosphotransferase n=1 Tax=Pseudogemmobacter sonorensis TaxID=2989681 RepID=UPI00368A0607